MKWESILKKEWTVDDYEHPVVKELFNIMKNREEKNQEEIYEPQYKALKFFETSCSKYDISLYSSQDSYLRKLKVFLPNDTALFCNIPPAYNFARGTPEIVATIFLKDGKCPVCIKTPEGGSLPFYDYIVSMVDAAAHRGRGMNIDGFDLANKWIEKDIIWGRGNYFEGPILFTPIEENPSLFRHLTEEYYDDPDKMRFIIDSLRPYGKYVMEAFDKQYKAFKKWGRLSNERRV